MTTEQLNTNPIASIKKPLGFKFSSRLKTIREAGCAISVISDLLNEINMAKASIGGPPKWYDDRIEGGLFIAVNLLGTVIEYAGEELAGEVEQKGLVED